MDTGNDARLAMAEAAVAELTHVFERSRLKAQLPKAKLLEQCRVAHGHVMTLRYAYVDAKALRELPAFAALGQAVDAIEELVGGPGLEDRVKEEALAVATTRWALATLRSLEARLDLPGDALENGVEVVVGRVVSASKHPSADNLLVTRVAAGRALRVVTNDASMQADDTVGIALLPPVELRGVVSEGMFLGRSGEGVLRNVREGALGRPDVDAAAYAETRGLIANTLARK